MDIGFVEPEWGRKSLNLGIVEGEKVDEAGNEANRVRDRFSHKIYVADFGSYEGNMRAEEPDNEMLVGREKQRARLLNLLLNTAQRGAYLVTGYSDSNASGDKTEDAIGDRDFWVVKLSAGGTLMWENTIGGINFDDSTVVVETVDGTFIVGGNSRSNVSGDKTIQTFGNMDHWLVELDNTGVIVDQAVWGGDRDDQVFALVSMADGSLLQGGFSSSGISGNKAVDTNGGLDLWLTRFSCLSDD